MNYDNEVIKRVYENVHVEEGISLIHNFLVKAYLYEGISVKRLANMLFMPVPVISAIKNELKKQKLLDVKNGICLTDEGKRFVKGGLGYETVDCVKLLRVLEDEEISLEDFSAEIEFLNEIYVNRPDLDTTLDQSFCTAETGIKRGLLMLKSGGLIGKNIALLGDDDLDSIAIVLVLKHIAEDLNGALKLTVFDIDERILSYIEDNMKKLNFQITCIKHDLREAIPDTYKNKYDSVFTDPPYTLEGLKLFLSRGVSLLKKESDLFFYLAYAHKAPLSQLEAQRQFLDAGLIIKQIYSRFNQYYGAQILGGVSDTIVLNTTVRTAELVTDKHTEPIYTNEVNRSVRVYECKNCRHKFKVGHGEEIKTIEQLKVNGCVCGFNKFNLQEKTNHGNQTDSGK